MLKSSGMLMIIALSIVAGSSSEAVLHRDASEEFIQFDQNEASPQAILQGDDRFYVAWRRQPPSSNVTFTQDGLLYKSADGDRVLMNPNGDLQLLSQLAAIPSPLNRQLPEGLALSNESIELRKADRLVWSFQLPTGRKLESQTVHSDARGNLYFHDDRLQWYSIGTDGQLRYSFQPANDNMPDLSCHAVRSGDAFCRSTSFGIIGIREKTNAPRLYIQGTEYFPTHPTIIREGSAYVPLRFVMEHLGANVEWNAQNGLVTVTKDDMTITMNTREKDETFLFENDVTYIALRQMSEGLGASVFWESPTRTILIIDK